MIGICMILYVMENENSVGIGFGFGTVFSVCRFIPDSIYRSDHFGFEFFL